MKRGLLTYIMLIIFSVGAIGKTQEADMPRFTFGAEWAYGATLFFSEHHYFLTPDGFREEIDEDRFGYDTDGEVSMHFGYNINRNWNLSLHLGYTSIGDFHRAVPMSVRATRYFGDNPLKDRWFTFVDLGSGVSIRKDPKGIATGKIGGGYRLSLSRYSKLDFLVSLRGIYTHPQTIYYGEPINRKDVFRDNGFICGLSLGIGLTF